MIHLIDYAIIIVSLLGSLYIGGYFSKKQTTTKAYFTANGAVPSWAVGISIFATIISSITFLAYPGEGFKSNWLLLVQGIMTMLVMLGMIWFVIPLYRNNIGISAYEYFEKRFGFPVRAYCSIAFALTHFAKMGTILFLIALALSTITGVSPYLATAVISFTVIFVALKGGMEGIIWLDVAQGFLLVGGSIVSLFMIVWNIEGGFSTIFEVASQHDKMGFGPYDWSLHSLTFAVMVLNGLFYGVQKYGADQTIVQRYLTTSSTKQAIKATLIGGLLSLPSWTLFMFIGTALFAYYGEGQNLPVGMQPDEVFPYFIMTELPIGVMGIVLSALIAAAISTLDADLNCFAAIAVEDFYMRFYPVATEERKIAFGRQVILWAGVASFSISLVYIVLGSSGLLGIIFGLYAIFSGGVAGIFLLAIATERTNAAGIKCGIFSSILFTAWAVLTSKFGIDFGGWNFTHHYYMIAVYSNLLVLVVGYLSSLFWIPKKVAIGV